MIKKIIIVLVLMLAVVNSTAKDNVERETGNIIISTAGFSKPNGKALYHVLPQSCIILERGSEWSYIQLSDGTIAYIHSDALK